MTQQASVTVQHRNNLDAYLGDFMSTVTMMSQMTAVMGERDVSLSLPDMTPTTFESFRIHTYDLSVILSELNDRLRLLEGKPPIQLDYQAYAEAGVFLKAFYLFFRILLADLAGVIEYFYKKNEPGVQVRKSFSALLKKAEDGILPEGLSRLLQHPRQWFPEMKRRERCFGSHQYDSFLLTIEQRGGSGSTIRHASRKMRSAGIWSIEDIREYFGFLLCKYQTLIDDLLDHFDAKFAEWYRIVRGQAGRTLTIYHGCVAIPLWWAHKYGHYAHNDMGVAESDGG